MLLFGSFVLTGIVLARGMIPFMSESFANIIFLNNSLTFMMVYVWSKQNPFIHMSFLGLFNFTTAYLPWCGTLAYTKDGGAYGVENSVQNMGVSEENGSTEGGQAYVDGEKYNSESRGEDESLIEDDDDDNDESVQPGEASIGKKVWTFLTT